MAIDDAVPGRVEQRLGLGFADRGLLELALTHRSSGASNNERLEFLGDAFLGFAIARELYQRFPGLDEGVLSRTRASLVKRSTLAEIAREIDLGECIRLGPGELRSGGWRRDSILADTLEALIGAVLVDAGEVEANALIARLYARRLQELEPGRVDKDPKTRLQELLQARRLALPEYTLVATHGEPHEREFIVSCQTEGLDLPPTQASGSSRRRAEQAAAAAVLAILAGQGE